MARKNTVWGIDVGQGALKAIKLKRGASGNHELQEFEVIEHSQILTHAGSEAPSIIQATLDAFLARHDVTDSRLAVSVLGQTSFTRFVKLPPVEPKKIPDIVRFEAEQQIPFPIEDVTWRWQTFLDPDSPDIEVGIFAMKQVDVSEMLSYFIGAGIEVDVVQMAPLALYNMACFDEQVASDGATLLVDVGADKTHLVIADGARTWTRTIQIGGNSFTEALVKSFKLPFAKAEKLKRTAASSKYARQIFQVMRPVFADMVQEIQRTIGHYTQRHRESRFSLLLGTGNGFRLPGMQKYLEQNLNMSVHRIDSYSHIAGASDDFQANSLSMGVAIGLAAQALDDAPVETNMLPESIAAKRRWESKKPWFAVAAAALVVAAGLYPLNAMSDLSKLESAAQQSDLDDAQALVREWSGWDREEGSVGGDVEKQHEEILDRLKLRAYSSIQPRLDEAVREAFLRTLVTPKDRAILREFAAGTREQQEQWAQQLQTDQAILTAVSLLPFSDAPEGETTLREQLIEKLASRPRTQRSILVQDVMTTTYASNLQPQATQDGPEPDVRRTSGRGRSQATSKAKADVKRGYEVAIQCRTPLGVQAATLKQTQLKNELEALLNADPNFEVLDISLQISEMSAGSPSTPTRTSPAVGSRSVRGVDMMAEQQQVFDPMMGGGPRRTTGRQPAQPQPSDEVLGNDPTFTAESTDQDYRFSILVKLAVVGDGLNLPAEEDESTTSSSDRRNRR